MRLQAAVRAGKAGVPKAIFAKRKAAKPPKKQSRPPPQSTLENTKYVPKMTLNDYVIFNWSVGAVVVGFDLETSGRVPYYDAIVQWCFSAAALRVRGGSAEWLDLGTPPLTRYVALPDARMHFPLSATQTHGIKPLCAPCGSSALKGADAFAAAALKVPVYLMKAREAAAAALKVAVGQVPVLLVGWKRPVCEGDTCSYVVSDW